jgi:hypothetical protein
MHPRDYDYGIPQDDPRLLRIKELWMKSEHGGGVTAEEIEEVRSITRELSELRKTIVRPKTSVSVNRLGVAPVSMAGQGESMKIEAVESKRMTPDRLRRIAKRMSIHEDDPGLVRMLDALEKREAGTIDYGEFFEIFKAFTDAHAK